MTAPLDLDKLDALVARMRAGDPDLHYGIAAGELLDAAPELLRLSRIGAKVEGQRAVLDARRPCPGCGMPYCECDG